MLRFLRVRSVVGASVATFALVSAATVGLQQSGGAQSATTTTRPATTTTRPATTTTRPATTTTRPATTTTRPATTTTVAPTSTTTTSPTTTLAPVACSALSPSTVASVNYSNILTCLSTGTKTAGLNDGNFSIDQMISMPVGSSLLRSATATGYPVVSLTMAKQAVVDMTTNTRVGFVTLRANSNLAVGCCSATVIFSGSGNFLDDAIIEPTSNPNSNFGIGAYFLCDSCTGNTALRVQVHNGLYGILVNTKSGAAGARIESSAVWANGCHGLTFLGGATSATVINNTISNNGSQCFGSGIFAQDNTGQFVLDGNTVFDNCGPSIGLRTVSLATVKNNNVYSPGNTALAAGCSGAVSMSLHDVSGSTITNNVVRNEGRPTNTLGSRADVDKVYRDTDGIWFGDLPAGANTVVAASLSTTRDNMSAKANSFDGNAFIGNCAAPCYGIGLFTSRGTGFAADGSWSASTTNYFTNNRVNGSNAGSRRGGANWFAANSTCAVFGAPAPCNDDDSQHNPPGGSWSRSDLVFEKYSPSLAAPTIGQFSVAVGNPTSTALLNATGTPSYVLRVFWFSTSGAGQTNGVVDLTDVGPNFSFLASLAGNGRLCQSVGYRDFPNAPQSPEMCVDFIVSAPPGGVNVQPAPTVLTPSELAVTTTGQVIVSANLQSAVAGQLVDYLYTVVRPNGSLESDAFHLDSQLSTGMSWAGLVGLSSYSGPPGFTRVCGTAKYANFPSGGQRDLGCEEIDTSIYLGSSSLSISSGSASLQDKCAAGEESRSANLNVIKSTHFPRDAVFRAGFSFCRNPNALLTSGYSSTGSCDAGNSSSFCPTVGVDESGANRQDQADLITPPSQATPTMIITRHKYSYGVRLGTGNLSVNQTISVLGYSVFLVINDGPTQRACGALFSNPTTAPDNANFLAVARTQPASGAVVPMRKKQGNTYVTDYSKGLPISCTGAPVGNGLITLEFRAP
jgi:Right handed beta helix region